jgi:hypothetical protein
MFVLEGEVHVGLTRKATLRQLNPVDPDLRVTWREQVTLVTA